MYTCELFDSSLFLNIQEYQDGWNDLNVLPVWNKKAVQIAKFFEMMYGIKLYETK